MDISEEVHFSSSEFNSTFQYLNTNNNISEDGMELSKQTPVLKLIIDYLILICTIIMLAAMGCTLTVEQIVQNVKRPIGISIGMFSQFVILPLTGFCLAKIVDVDELTATGILIISCCPGGLASNVFTYYCDGDVSLSVTMTASSTLMAMVLMPLNLWLYGRGFETGRVYIPYAKLAKALLMVTSPVIAGIMIRWKWTRTASIIAKVGSFVSSLLIVILMILMAVSSPNIFVGGQSKIYEVVHILPLLGFTLGYVSATVLGQTTKVCKTIAIESGFQNSPFAMGMIALSFPPEQQIDLLRIPVLYGFSTFFFCAFISIVYQAYKKCANSEQQKSQHVAKENCERQEQEQIEIKTEVCLNAGITSENDNLKTEASN